MVECQHLKTELRCKTFSNGTHHFCEQCLECGCQVSNFIKKPDNAEQIKEWDSALVVQYNYIQSEKLRQKFEQEQFIRVKERDEWWKKYHAYLHTPEWKAKAHLVLKRCNHLCEGCGKRKAFIVHHLTYEHIFDEFLWELVGVCGACHEKAHPDYRSEICQMVGSNYTDNY